MAKRKSSKELPGGCLALFGLPFLAAGLFMSGLYFSGYSKWWAARSWEEVPCWIESAELEVNRGDGSDTYQATASYRYAYQGRTFRNDRVSFHRGGDNIGGFQRNAHRELSAYREGGRLFRCHVNPAAPSEAVLYRGLRWEMQALMAIFALTFPTVGVGLVAGGVMSAVAARKSAVLRARHPGEPWKWRPQWAADSIPENAVKWRTPLYLFTLWSGLVVWVLIASAAMSGAFEQGGTAWLLLVFPASWCIPAWFSIRRFRHRLAVGIARYEPRETPVWPGGVLEGSILLRRPPPMRLPAEVELVCEKSVTTGSGKNRSTTTENIWSHQETVPPDSITRDFSGFRLPVKFTLPADAPESSPAAQNGTKHVWSLRFKVPGMAIRSAFELPVFRTEKSPTLPAVTSTAAPSILDEISANLPAMLAARRIRADFDQAGVPRSLICPPARNRSIIAFLIFFDLIWTTVAVFLVKENAPLVFRVVWPVSAAGIWMLVIWNIFHQRSVTFGSSGVEVRNQLGPVIWTQAFEKAQITRFSHDSNMSSGNTRFYRVRLESVLGKKKTLVDGITGSNTAAALVKRLKAWKQQ